METETDTATRRNAREEAVRTHLQAENEQDFDAAIATFGHPRYELMASGEVYDGEASVRGYYARSRATFPDQRNENVVLHHADDAVIVEFDLLGTHAGNGRTFRSRMVALFLFEGDRIVCERVYYDSATILGQLGIGG